MRETNRERKWIHGRGHVNRNFQLTKTCRLSFVRRKRFAKFNVIPDANNTSGTIILYSHQIYNNRSITVLNILMKMSTFIDIIMEWWNQRCVVL